MIYFRGGLGRGATILYYHHHQKWVSQQPNRLVLVYNDPLLFSDLSLILFFSTFLASTDFYIALLSAN
jgi:hypothetical protein